MSRSLFRFTTKLSLEECLTSLERRTRPDQSWVTPFGTRRQFTSVTTNPYFRVQQRNTRDTFLPEFRGHLYHRDGKTYVVGQLANTYHLWVVFTLVTIFGCGVCVFFWSLEPFPYLLALWGALAFIAYTGHPDRDILVAFVKDTLHAEDTDEQHATIHMRLP